MSLGLPQKIVALKCVAALKRRILFQHNIKRGHVIRKELIVATNLFGLAAHRVNKLLCLLDSLRGIVSELRIPQSMKLQARLTEAALRLTQFGVLLGCYAARKQAPPPFGIRPRTTQRNSAGRKPRYRNKRHNQTKNQPHENSCCSFFRSVQSR